ncbi:alpha-amylase family protein [Erythrobacter sp. HL-111]|uniref:alpha-amylase family protein n=1 Tax=Erythrobacter sp. HL-111 TaxID=1798193 RepID=UPI0006DB0629|nr:alpha-amylase family protein [Erythrobacter sp. HL-111]KPP88621.1 MAG: maltose alpha-D-glucosyltransferase/ alpha-amylase [Erythrobacteraceae bacterium HL-111]SDS32183.1 maltose alpha-D-glucosyltransferase/ alpha-amylase [Erythrobacter sp. HL-111]
MNEERWYRNAVIYSLSLDSFLDSNGDGVGDFAGLLDRVDYLQGLGVTAIWLMPFHPSPGRDHGYDVADYYGVDPCYGSLGDFVEFTQACRQRGIRVLMDLVLNHTSNEHPWFLSAASDPDSRYRDFYIWADERPEDADEGMVFPGVQETTWTWHETAGAYYFHKFHDFQPDLNLANPQVQAELLKIVGFWLELGISGFRVDAVPFLIAADGIDVKDPEPAFGLLRRLRDFAQWRKGEVVFLAEANIPSEDCTDYFGEAGDRLQMMFNFPVNQALFLALATGDATRLKEELRASQGVPPNAQWAHFLRNHDELDIGRLSEEERDAVFEAFGPDEDMQLYDRGIRRRLAPMLGGDRARLELAYSLMLTMPGTPVIRYGDEIGMGDDLSLPQREAARTPMQWSGDRNAGFSSAADPVRPVIDEGPYGYRKCNVAMQRASADSFLRWTEATLRMRKELTEIGHGDFSVLDSPAHILALRYVHAGRVSFYTHNLIDERVEFAIEMADEPGCERELVCLQTNRAIPAEADGRHDFVLEPHGYRWFRMGGLEDMVVERRPAADRPSGDAG